MMFRLCYRLCTLGVLLEMVHKEASRAFAAYEIIAMSTILMTLSIYVHKYD